MVEELSFPLGMAEHLRYYVYALRDPRPGCGIFYVGKGKGNRVYQHALASLAHQEDEVEVRPSSPRAPIGTRRLPRGRTGRVPRSWVGEVAE